MASCIIIVWIVTAIHQNHPSFVSQDVVKQIVFCLVCFRNGV